MSRQCAGKRSVILHEHFCEVGRWTLTDVNLDNRLFILERALAELLVVIVAVMGCLSKKIQAVQMMQTLYVSGKSTSVLWTDFDLVLCDTGFLCVRFWDSDGAV
jgi:hypothetical protein